MTPEQFRRVEEIYFRVVDLPPGERDRALAAACADDEPVAREVRAMLDGDEHTGGVLDSPALGPEFTAAAPVKDDELVGTRVGRYRIESRIASGGMGTVYRSVQEGEFARPVAIKVVKRGMDSDEIVRRFMAERLTLAGLNHPNIAGLIDGGALPDGRPFLVMELVDGVPIHEFCDRRRLGIGERLALFRTVCDAVGYAHQRLVVHRDLKPSNILVTGDGVPKLLDFGIAKVLRGTGSAPITQTMTQERRLTPEYASPEQITGRTVTTATDVYSLGVILYELLTGHRPYRFDTRTTAEYERVVTGTEPLAPSSAVTRPPEAAVPGDPFPTRPTPDEVGAVRDSTPERLRRQLKGDLDTIVLMALRKDPQRRYSSVEQFAADIDRYLHNLPVKARKDTVRYRVVKFVHRNTAASVIGAAAVLALSAGIVSVEWQARVAARERDGAFSARDQAEAVNDFLQSMLRSADPTQKSPEVSVRDLLDDTAERITTELADRPLTQAAIRNTVGATYLSLGLYDQAEEHLRAAYDQRVALLGPRHHDVGESKNDLAALLYAQGKYPEAEGHLRDALEIFRSVRGDHNIDVARTASSLGAVLRAQGRLDEAEQSHRESLAIRRGIGDGQTKEVAESLNNLGAVLRQQGKLPEAEDVTRQALEIRRRVLGEEHPLTAQGYANLAVMTYHRGDIDEAEKLFRRSIELEEKTLGPDHPELGTTLNSLGFLLIKREDYAGAVPVLRRSLEIREKSLGVLDSRTLRGRVLLASAQRQAGQLDDAESTLQPALKSTEDESVPPEVRQGVADEAARLRDAREGETKK